ncbi:MAG TPA: PilZ domain-containing protein [Thermoanaerobaculia bacterium]|nr:PilZ domain-containing protein [Thermoanaerobaculia bacterium]
MDFPRTRRVQRVHLAQPLVARLGAARIVLVDISILGARVEHHVPLVAGAHARLSFEWQDETIETDCRIVRSRLERFSVGADGLTIYHSGLEFVNMSVEMRQRLKDMIGRFIMRALEEQKLNARGVIPQHDVSRMPIFRFGGQLSANADQKEFEGSPLLPTTRIATETGYLCYSFENGRWRHKRTHDPGQPMEGFTISATEEHSQIELLCDAYQRSDADGRRMIQLCAQLSTLGDGVVPGRFDP